MTIKTIQTRWSTAATVAASADWLSADVSVAGAFPVKHNFQMMVPTSTIVKAIITRGGVAKNLEFNAGVALTADAGYNFSVIMWPGTTYNITHDTGTQNVALMINESDNIDQ